ncbi:MAG: hypothetical protein QM811_22325 [Pirellulales bacterium]
MSGAVAERKRLLRVTADDLAAGTLSLRGHDDFFPASAIPDVVELRLEDFAEPRTASLTRATRCGKLRAFAREETWPAEFFARHALGVGDVLALERLGEAQLSVVRLSIKSRSLA